MIDWQYLLQGDLEQTEICSKSISWGLPVPERLIMVTWPVTWKSSEMKEIGELVATLLFWDK